MTKLSVNINKIATIRNARGGNIPSITKAAIKCQEFGAHGITVHPRPDQRHITYEDIFNLKPLIYKEFNIEGNPEKIFIDLILKIKPNQVTLVPDTYNQITSNHGWDIKKNFSFLKEIIKEFKKNDIRTSIFIDPDIKMIEYATKTGTDRVELYTHFFAKTYKQNPRLAVKKYKDISLIAKKNKLLINAGHDLSLDNIQFLLSEVPLIEEVSIGHALISEALYIGLENTIKLYLKKIKEAFILNY